VKDIPKRFEPPHRLLMGPGPSSVSPRVLEAMAVPVIGHLDPATFDMMNDLQDMLRRVFQTSNELTYPVSGTGTAGMETALANTLEPGDVAITLVSGFFAERMREIAKRCGAEIVTVGGEWGRPVELDDVALALEKHPGAKAVCAVHVETSTGLLQPLQEVARLSREHGALFLVDAVASLGGVEVDVDGWGVDVCYSGSQKCLSAPPGLAPITFSDRAYAAMEGRADPPSTFYLDATQIRRYVGSERLYHHTAPVSMLYALHEALRIVLEEGLEERWARHMEIGAELLAVLEDRGFKSVPLEGYRVPYLASVWLPEGFEDKPNRSRLLEEFGIEIAGGLGQFSGKIWRVGVMGESCNRDYVKAFTEALDTIQAK
jgi:alanine-glyoxylate transaminase / serine-glyoxylate transaminase / serine-pyruvate transaminase